MSARSSSASWSARGRPPDIIDLDKFMRGAVRPSRPETRFACEQLVVDAGGARRPALRRGARSGASSSDSSGRPPHGKRFSHDSGLSDGSYPRRKHRAHRQTASPGSGVTGRREPTSPGAPAGRGSSHSFRAFRAVCERALLDQQEQIARVAELCERLTERRADSRRSGSRRERSTTDSSDVSTSSHSSRDRRRTDRRRTDQCKTYKIIMTKLDELNRLFVARAQAAPRRAAPPSSRSVSVSDKFVSTEPVADRRSTSVNCYEARPRPAALGAPAGGAPLRAVTPTCELDPAPRDGAPFGTRASIAKERHETPCAYVVCSAVRRGRDGSAALHRAFDLDDPVRLYTQAKRLQGLHTLPASTRRACSADHLLAEQLANKLSDKLDERRGPSLCALCRGYWRALRHYFTAQIFGCH